MTRGPGRKLTPEQREQATETLAKAREARRAKKEQEQEEEMPPTVNTRTWAWLHGEVEAGRITTVKFVPDETIPVTWRGIRAWLTAGVEIELPEPLYAVYRDSRRNTAEAFRNAEQSLAQRTGGQYSVGVGWVPGEE